MFKINLSSLFHVCEHISNLFDVLSPVKANKPPYAVSICALVLLAKFGHLLQSSVHLV